MSKFNTLLLLFSGFISFGVKAQAPSIVLQNFASGFNRPVDIAHCKDSRLFIVEQDGFINIVSSNGTVNPTLFLNIDAKVGSNGNEEGLLGLAFHPDYKSNGYFYVYYTNNSGNIVISRYTVSAVDSNLADAASELILITIPHPTNSNHNGGCLKFGPDGYLYAATGDGGGGGDIPNNAQSLNKRLGKMLRFDVNTGTLYGIPPDNPYINTANAFPEIWAHGLRNSWRYSFDRITGDLWIADVGQNAWEEVNFQAAGTPGGKNYGWRCYEGNHPYNTAGCLPIGSYFPAIFELAHSGGYCSITGGYVYRGAKYSNMFGYYFFSDYCNSMIQVLKKNAGTYLNYNTVNYTNAAISTFGEDQYGEMYVADLNTGQVKKIVSSVCAPTAFIAATDTLYVCADSVMLSTPEGDSLFYSWQIPGGSGNTHSIWVNQDGWASVTVLNYATCQSTDSVYVVIKGSPPQASFTGLDSVYCSNLSPADSLTGNPAGGVFTGKGMTGNVFYADSAGNGTFIIRYDYTDVDGCVSAVSQVIQVSTCVGIEQSYSTLFTVFGANPASGDLKLRMESLISGSGIYSITDVSGRIISEGALDLVKGEQSLNIPMNQADDGVYFWRLSLAGSSVTYRFAWIR